MGIFKIQEETQEIQITKLKTGSLMLHIKMRLQINFKEDKIMFLHIIKV